MFLLMQRAILCFLLTSAGPAFAHAHTSPAPTQVQWSWSLWIIASLAVAAVWYARGAVRLYRRLGSTRLLGPGEMTAYGGGLATLFVALVSPIDSIADQLFWVHMTQHLLLLLMAAPLLVLGRPPLAFLWAFGPTGRRRLGRGWTALGLRRGIDALMHPLVVWLVFCGGFAFWHFPGPYQWALRNEGVHTLEHLSFLVTALMFWSIVIEPSGRRRLAYGSTMVFVATAAILSSLPGALITLASRPLYPIHTEGVSAWGLTLLQDQQLAGLVMWIPGGFAFLAALAFVFVKWLQHSDGERVGFVTRVASPAILLCALPLLLGSCNDDRRPSARVAEKPRHAASLIRYYGCGSCHVVPGIAEATGVVGPPLTQIGRRVYIAGLLRNTPDNMVAWLRNPQRIVPGNVMPDMGLSEADAREIAAYLQVLR